MRAQADAGPPPGGGGDRPSCGRSSAAYWTSSWRSWGDEPMETDEFSRLLRQVAGQYSVGTIPVSLDQVSVTEITRNDRHTDKYLFLLGGQRPCAAGRRPERRAILNDDDREELAQRGIRLAPSGMEQMGHSSSRTSTPPWPSPRRGLTVSYPAADVTGAELRPAFVVDRLLALFPAVRVEREPLDRSYRLTAPPPGAGRPPARTRRAPLWRHFSPPIRPWRRPWRPCGGRRTCGGAACPTGRCGRCTGSGFPCPPPGRSGLRSCHFAYFMEYGLKARPRRPAALRMRHRSAPSSTTCWSTSRRTCWTGEALPPWGGGGPPRPGAARYIDRYAAEELGGPGGAERPLPVSLLPGCGTPPTRWWTRSPRRCAQLRLCASGLRALLRRPGRAAGGDGDGAGRPAADRRQGGPGVDGWVKDGKLYLRVVDYKSGRKAFDLSAVRMGLDIQNAALSLRPGEGGESSASAMDIEPAGVLYLPARDEILSAERSVTADQLRAQRDKELRRTGAAALGAGGAPGHGARGAEEPPVPAGAG